MAGFTGIDIVEEDNLVAYLDFSSPKFKSGSSYQRPLNINSYFNLYNDPTITDDYFTLDGTNDYVEVELSEMTNKPSCTICAWIKWESNNGGMFLGFSSYDIWTNGGKLGFNNGASNIVGISSSQVTNLGLIGNWHHYAFVMDAARSMQTYNKLFIDGIKYDITNVLANDGAGRQFTNKLTLGSWNNGGFNGNVSFKDLSVYNKELLEPNIKKIYNQKRSIYNKPYAPWSPPTPPPPFAITSTTASNAYEIKQANPNATSGYYYIENSNINSGSPFLIYADMETDGGGWTLIVRNTGYEDWNATTALEYNTGSIVETDNYSILKYADYLKSSTGSFEYMMEAGGLIADRNNNGGIWTANVGSYSFTSSLNTNTDITLDTKFGSWNYSNNGIEERMPYYTSTTNNGILTTSVSVASSWWGTIITATSGWVTAPWGSGISEPNFIWYWVR